MRLRHHTQGGGWGDRSGLEVNVARPCCMRRDGGVWSAQHGIQYALAWPGPQSDDGTQLQPGDARGGGEHLG